MYLINGATGYIGFELYKHLLSTGAQIRVLIRKHDKAFENDQTEIVIGDLENLDALNKACDEITTVFHLAALARVWSKNENDFYRINVTGTNNMLNAAERNGVKNFVNTSTGGTISPSNKNQLSTEATERTIPFFNLYESTKFEAEQLCKSFALKSNMRIVTVNPPRVFGFGKSTASNGISRLIKAYLYTGYRFIPGNGKSIGNYVFIDDLVRGMVLASEKGKSGERYILGGHNLTFIELFDLIKELSGVDKKMFHLPLWLMLFASRIMKVTSALGNKGPAITPEWVKKYLYQWALSSDKAINDLNYEITPMKTALQKTINDIKQNHG